MGNPRRQINYVSRSYMKKFTVNNLITASRYNYHYLCLGMRMHLKFRKLFHF